MGDRPGGPSIEQLPTSRSQPCRPPPRSRRVSLDAYPGLAAQLTHPLPLLLWIAAAVSLAVGNVPVAIAVLLVIFLNAFFALIQELQTECAVEDVSGYLPQHATLLRDGRPQVMEAGRLVPTDVVLIEEGERIPADLRLLSGSVEVDTSTLTGESVPVMRSADPIDVDVPRLEARDLLVSGSNCTSGDARVIAVAVGMALAFAPLAVLGAGLSIKERGRVRDRPAGGKRRRKSAACDHAGAGGRRPRARDARHCRQAAKRGRDARLHRRDLDRQDRPADREPSAARPGLDTEQPDRSRQRIPRPSGAERGRSPVPGVCGGCSEQSRPGMSSPWPRTAGVREPRIESRTQPLAQ
jgi:E1-E2 ATPase